MWFVALEMSSEGSVDVFCSLTSEAATPGLGSLLQVAWCSWERKLGACTVLGCCKVINKDALDSLPRLSQTLRYGQLEGGPSVLVNTSVWERLKGGGEVVLWERSRRCILHTLPHFSLTTALLDAVRRGVSPALPMKEKLGCHAQDCAWGCGGEVRGCGGAGMAELGFDHNSRQDSTTALRSSVVT